MRSFLCRINILLKYNKYHLFKLIIIVKKNNSIVIKYHDKKGRYEL